MSWSEILNILLGGGVLTLVVGVVTLRATVRRANAEAQQALAAARRAEADVERARVDAETVRITNTENATRILVENIVKPLKEELNATREDLQATKREMASTKRAMGRLSRAVESANNCRHADGCPVLRKLRDREKDEGGERVALPGGGGERGERGERTRGLVLHNKDDPEGDDPGGEDGDCGVA